MLTTPTTITTKLQEALDLFAMLVATKMAKAVPGRKDRKFSTAKMRCRANGCRKRSRGPRFHFLCARHLKRQK